MTKTSTKENICNALTILLFSLGILYAGSFMFSNHSYTDVTTTQCKYGTFNEITNVCDCFQFYTKKGTDKCDYPQLSRTKAAALELFLGFAGAGHYYTGRIEYMAAQIVVLVLVILTFAAMASNPNVQRVDANAQGAGLVILMIAIIGIVMWFVGIVGYFFNITVDGNDMVLV